jgi:hypothetical protein
MPITGKIVKVAPFLRRGKISPGGKENDSREDTMEPTPSHYDGER